MSNMFEGAVDLDPSQISAEEMQYVLGVRLFQHETYGYVTVMETPEGDVMIQQLPEALQSMIPMYLPMVMQALGNGG